MLRKDLILCKTTSLLKEFVIVHGDFDYIGPRTQHQIPNPWFSLKILVKKNSKNGHLGRIWPTYYRTTSQFLHRGPVCPNKNNTKTRIVMNRLI